jgi:hypothetical protein
MFEEQPSFVIEGPVERTSQDGVSNTEIEEQHRQRDGSAP